MRYEKIIVNYSADKLQAIKILAPDIYKELEKQLSEQLEKIYVKVVPASTRKYIQAKMEMEDSPPTGSRKQ